MFVAIKQGVGDGDAFTESDLEGTWYLSGASSGGANEGTIVGTMILDSAGLVTGGSYTHSDGTVAILESGMFPINGEGELSAGNDTPFITTDIGISTTVIMGKMNASRDTMTYVSINDLGELDMVVAIKGD
jgi:hypothetical protein